MKNVSTKFLIIGLVTLACVAILLARKLERGIDLSGGTILVYQVQAEAGRAADMDELIGALKKRVNPDGMYDIAIRQVGSDRVEIVMPEDMAEQAEDVKRKLTEEGSLEFRILASTAPAARFPARLKRVAEGPSLVDRLPEVDGFQWARLGEGIEGVAAQGAPTKVGERSITDSAQDWPVNRYRGMTAILTEEADGGAARRREMTIERNTKDTLFFNQDVGPDPASITGYRVDYMGGPASVTDLARRWKPNRYVGQNVLLEDGDGVTKLAKVVSNDADTLVFEADHGLRSITRYQLSLNPSGITGASELERFLILKQVRVATQPGVTEAYALYEVPAQTQDVTGAQLNRVYLTQDQQMRPAVGFQLDGQGARRFGSLTGRYGPREDGAFRYNLAILLDGELQSAPYLNARITDSGIIEMGGTNVVDEVNFLIDILRAGSLPVALVTPPLQEETIGPTLGEDTIRKGVLAILISLVFVPLFMILYYRIAGVIAVLALLLNMLLLMAFMALTGSSITLPGLAGLALTIGMAVDSSVLVFERMREERDRGATLPQQIRNGFDRAWSTIFDSNVSTILSGLILMVLGTEEVKGFALVLIVGLVANLFTAVFASRALFELFYKLGWIKRLSMMQLLTKTRINFVGWRRPAMLLSLVVIGIGLGLFFNRGGARSDGDIYNIDFTGGTLVTVRLDDPDLAGRPSSARVAAVRAVAGRALPNAYVESLAVRGEDFPRYNIRTTERDTTKVQEAVVDAFGSKLVRATIESREPAPIPADDPSLPFAGGTSYRLALNLAEPPSKLARAFAETLAAARPAVANPETRFEITNPEAPPNDPDERGRVLVLSTNLEPAVAEARLADLSTKLQADKGFLFERLENFSGVVAEETRQTAVVAIVASWVSIILYLWFRFKSISFGLAAVIALVHDVLVALGAVALAGYKIDLPMIAAFLTLIGFSVNDTIVIFDRIREIRGKSPDISPELINDALNVTLSRTILTTFTTWTVVFIFWLVGGEGLAAFSFCLVVGFISGTYSTVFIAAPILIEWFGRRKKAKLAGAGAASLAGAR